MNNLNSEERDEVVIVVFIADMNNSYRDWVLKHVQDNWRSEVESGLIQVIVAPKEFYPDMNNLPPLFGDSPERVKWRSKQSLDYSFMWYYCQDLSKYYIQVEDDVLTEGFYFKRIKSFINQKEKDGEQWSCLEFGREGFIGVLYDSKHLRSLASFSRLLFWAMPIDYLFRKFNDVFLYGNAIDNIYAPSLFEHVGRYSTLRGERRELEQGRKKKKLVRTRPRYLKGKNPPAKLSTTILGHEDSHSINKPYDRSGFYWGKAVRAGDKIEIVFDTEESLKRVVIVSGSEIHPDDTLLDSELLASPEDEDGKCTSYVSLAGYSDAATVDYTFSKAMPYVKCIRLKIKKKRLNQRKSARWLVISDIAVMVAD